MLPLRVLDIQIRPVVGALSVGSVDLWHKSKV